MRRALPLLLLLTCLLSLIGCKDEVNATFKRRPTTYKKVVSLSPGTTEILASALLKYNLAGRTAADDWPMTVKEIPVVASLKPDYEKLGAIRPDLIVLDGDLYNEQDMEKLRQLGAATFVFKATTIEEYESQLFELATLLGGETTASSYIDKINIALTTGQATPPNPKPKVAIVMPSTAGDHMIDGVGSLRADIVRKLGGQVVGPEGKIFVKANPETLASLNPDVIIVPVPKKDPSGALALANDPRLQSISAIKNRRIKAIDADVLLRRGGRIDSLVSGIYRAIAAG